MKLEFTDIPRAIRARAGENTHAMKIRFALKKLSVFAAMAALLAIIPAVLPAQASRVMGTVTAVSGNTLTVKTDAGEQEQVAVPDSATLKRLAPGEKDLNAAPAIQLSDVAVGDRVLIRLDASASSPTASLVVAMKQADVAQVHQKDSEAWQRGVSGLVKNVDPASGAITIATGAGPTAKTVTVKTTNATKLLRYAPNSVRFADAKPAGLDAIKAGDQLRARGTKNADGTEVAADEVVSGTFRNIAGTVSSVDAGASTLVVKDLATKKPVTIHTGPESTMKQLPERMAQAIAMRLKGGAGAMGGGGATADSGRAGNGPAGAPNGGAGAGRGAAGGGSGAMERMLSMAPVVKLADLQKGQAVMVVATGGDNDVNAITLLSGVEPLLEAPAATNLLSNWSVGGGGGGEAAAGPQ
jgi:Cu/Ag efflux protein CusF